MNFSKFQKRFTEDSGIVRLMEDLGDANMGAEETFMLGGGNPAHIPEVQQFFMERLQRIAAEPVEFAHIIGDYDPPRGNMVFIKALVDLFNSQYDWNIGIDNIALTSGSQAAFFILFNMFSGDFGDGTRKKILLPILPEYIGYSDLGLSDDQFSGHKPEIETLDGNTFKYHVDFDNLTVGPDAGAICVSRPTNPTGNVLSDLEIQQLLDLAKQSQIPLIVDNAYGMPFPNVIFTDATLYWDNDIILCMSLSKFGLPGARTGIIIGNEKVVDSVVKMNAIFSLAMGSFGPALALDIIHTRDILHLSNNVIRHFYKRKAMQAVEWLHKELHGLNFYVHKTEGAIFLWLWLPDLPIDSYELYLRLKQKGVVVVPGNYFFPGLNEDWSHSRQCLRISYAMHDSIVERGIKIIGEEIRALYK
jgi:valine--pyruvate aminotransferase